MGMMRDGGVQIGAKRSGSDQPQAGAKDSFRLQIDMRNEVRHPPKRFQVMDCGLDDLVRDRVRLEGHQPVHAAQVVAVGARPGIRIDNRELMRFVMRNRLGNGVDLCLRPGLFQTLPVADKDEAPAARPKGDPQIDRVPGRTAGWVPVRKARWLEFDVVNAGGDQRLLTRCGFSAAFGQADPRLPAIRLRSVDQADLV